MNPRALALEQFDRATESDLGGDSAKQIFGLRGRRDRSCNRRGLSCRRSSRRLLRHFRLALVVSADVVDVGRRELEPLGLRLRNDLLGRQGRGLRTKSALFAVGIVVTVAIVFALEDFFAARFFGLEPPLTL